LLIFNIKREKNDWRLLKISFVGELMSVCAIYDPESGKSPEKWAKSEAYKLWKQPGGPKSSDYFRKHFVKNTVNGNQRILAETTWKKVLRTFQNGQYELMEEERAKAEGCTYHIISYHILSFLLLLSLHSASL